jgi:hypothetical protein
MVAQIASGLEPRRRAGTRFPEWGLIEEKLFPYREFSGNRQRIDGRNSFIFNV